MARESKQGEVREAEQGRVGATAEAEAEPRGRGRQGQKGHGKGGAKQEDGG